MKFLDGAMSSLLAHNQLIESPIWGSEFLLTDRNQVKKAHKEYIYAGADYITTCTYQLSVETCKKRRVDMLELYSMAIQVAREAIQEYRQETGDSREIQVLGSISSYGALYDRQEYIGDYTDVDDIIQVHRPRVEALVGQVDIILFETVPCLLEAKVIHQFMSSYNVPFWISFSCKNNKLNHGEEFSKCIGLADRVGVNCTDLTDIPPLHSGAFLYPNGGYYDKNKDEMIVLNPKEWASRLMPYKSIFMIGGCCGTTPDFIREIKELL